MDATDSKFYHVRRYAGNFRVIHQTIGGKQESPLYFKKNNITCIRRIKDICDDERRLIIKQGYNDIGVHYAYKSYAGYIIFQLLRKFGIKARNLVNMYHEGNNTVCSSDYAKDVLDSIKIKLCPNLDITQITPEDLYKSVKLETVFKGEVIC
jgi:hypothetical protein